MAKDTPVRSYSEALEAAGVPRQVDREFIQSLGTVTWISAEYAQARNPQTGELGDGYLATIEDANGKRYTSFIGNVALTRVLGQIDFPFKASLKKNGRTWVFAD